MNKRIQNLVFFFKIKNILKILVLLIMFNVFAQNLHAQIYASCTHRDVYKYNESSDDFEYVFGYDENSMFKINEKYTMFEHTTPDMSSSYYVSENEYDEKTKTLSMDVTSDVGNKYYFVFDIDDNEIRVLFTRDGVLQLLVYKVKLFWTEDNPKNSQAQGKRG